MRTILLAAALLVATAAPALARSIEIEEFEADVLVEADGNVRVVERLRIRFEGSWNGIFRVIPYGYTYPSGVRGDIRLDVEAVADAEGAPLRHWEERSLGRLSLKIAVPGATDAVRTVVVRYRARDVVRRWTGKDSSFGGHDEIYWNATGNDWEMPIRHAVARVRLPAGVPEDQVRTDGWTGAYGSGTRDVRTEREPDGAIRFEATRPLGVHEGLTVLVGFPPGHVAQPTTGQRLAWTAAANWPAAIPLLLLGLWFLAWWRKGRDPMAGRTVIPEFEAPEGLHPGAAGVLTDDRFDPRDLTASILDLAVRRVLTIHGEGKEDAPAFRLVLDPEARASAGLDAFEEGLVTALFGDKTEVRLDDLRYKAFAKLSGVRDRLLDGMVAAGLFRKRPDRTMGAWYGGAFFALVGLVVLGLWQDFPAPYWWLGLLVAPFLLVLARRMPARTSKGLDLLARVRGIEEYLVVAEKDRMARVPLPKVERLLPFAVALGVEEKWSEAFGDLLAAPPEWYRGAGWSAARFPGSFHQRLGTTVWAVPRAASSGTGYKAYGGRSWGGGWSGGGGFSGGGRSGGGFGGGGGRGW